MTDDPPMCSGCGHHASGIVAELCSTFVPYPAGDPRGHAGYCGHRCVDDPDVRAWLGPGYRPFADAIRELHRTAQEGPPA